MWEHFWPSLLALPQVAPICSFFSPPFFGGNTRDKRVIVWRYHKASLARSPSHSCAWNPKNAVTLDVEVGSKIDQVTLTHKDRPPVVLPTFDRRGARTIRRVGSSLNQTPPGTWAPHSSFNKEQPTSIERAKGRLSGEPMLKANSMGQWIFKK